MNLTEKDITKLESLLREGRDFLRKYYPDFKPRNSDSNAFEVVMHSRLHKHDDQYRIWAKKVLKKLDEEIGSDIYASRFINTMHPEKYTISAPDGFYWGSKTLESIINELRKIYFAESNIVVGSRTKMVTARFEYREPHILLKFDKSEECHLVHSLRNGSPKQIIERALDKPSLSASSGEFRAGNPYGNKVIRKSFIDVFRQFLNDERLRTTKISEFIIVTPTRVQLSLKPFLLPPSDAHKIARNFKKF